MNLMFMVTEDFNTFGHWEDNVKVGDVLELIAIDELKFINVATCKTSTGDEVKFSAGCLDAYCREMN